jgi:hypothetical protein
VLKPLIAAFLLTAAAALAACSPASEDETRTETIEPAVPAPGVPSDDPGLTQTTEIGEERSPNEGGVLAGPGVEGVERKPPTPTTTGSPPPRPPN